MFIGKSCLITLIYQLGVQNPTPYKSNTPHPNLTTIITITTTHHNGKSLLNYVFTCSAKYFQLTVCKGRQGRYGQGKVMDRVMLKMVLIQ